MDRSGGINSVRGILQEWKPYGLGLQVSPGVDDEVSISGVGWRCRAPVPGIVARDSTQQGDGDLRGINQPGSCAHADRDTAKFVGVESGAVPEREDFSSFANGVQSAAEALLGPTPVGEGILGSIERQRNG